MTREDFTELPWNVSFEVDTKCEEKIFQSRGYLKVSEREGFRS